MDHDKEFELKVRVAEVQTQAIYICMNWYHYRYYYRSFLLSLRQYICLALQVLHIIGRSIQGAE